MCCDGEGLFFVEICGNGGVFVVFFLCLSGWCDSFRGVFWSYGEGMRFIIVSLGVCFEFEGIVSRIKFWIWDCEEICYMYILVLGFRGNCWREVMVGNFMFV